MVDRVCVQKYNLSIATDPLKALYGRRCRSLIGWFEVGEFPVLISDMIHEAIESVGVARNRLKKG